MLTLIPLLIILFVAAEILGRQDDTDWNDLSDLCCEYNGTFEARLAFDEWGNNGNG